jgi:endogenous inhibitor of DNA gyrase (YacG/DUF329 family)
LVDLGRWASGDYRIPLEEGEEGADFTPVRDLEIDERN